MVREREIGSQEAAFLADAAAEASSELVGSKKLVAVQLTFTASQTKIERSVENSDLVFRMTLFSQADLEQRERLAISNVLACQERLCRGN